MKTNFFKCSIRTLSGILILSMLCPISVFAGASIGSSVSVCEANKVASEINFIDQCNDEQILVEDVTENKRDYDVSLDNADATIPKNGSNDIILEVDGSNDTVEISLPEYANDMKSKLADDGTVFFDAKSSDVSFAVQAIKEEVNGIELAGIRQLIVIDNNDAPHEYDFSFEVNKGCSIAKLNEIPGMLIENDDSDIYCVLNQDGEIVLELDTPWAQDANGDSLPTYYKVYENKIVQVVDFDENTAFPLIADPKATTTKVYTVSKTSYPSYNIMPDGQPQKGYKLNKGDSIFVCTNSGKTKSIPVSFEICKALTISFNIPFAKGSMSYSCRGVNKYIPSSKYNYQVTIKTVMKCNITATYRVLKNGKQVTDKHVKYSLYNQEPILIQLPRTK